MGCRTIMHAAIFLLLWKQTLAKISDSTELINSALESLKTNEFYEDLQAIMVKFVMHFEYNETMTINTGKGKKEIKRDDEIMNFDNFLILSTVATERMRKKVADQSFQYDYPVNAYKFIRNNTVVLQNVVNKMLATFNSYKDKERSKQVKALKNIAEHSPFPTMQDLMEATEALIDLQDIYALKPSDVANGLFLGDGSEVLNAEECMELAEVAKMSGIDMDYISWLEVARSRVVKWQDTSVEKAALYVQLYEAYFTAGCACAPEAQATRRQLIHLHPDNVQRYPNVCDDTTQETCVNKPNTFEDYTEKHPNDKTSKLSDTESKFKELCQRAANLWSNTTNSRNTNSGPLTQMSCYYRNSKDLFYHISPFKVEIVNQQPRIELVHDLLSQAENNLLLHHGKSNILADQDKKKTNTLPKKIRATSTTLKSNHQLKLVSAIQQRMSAVLDANSKSFGRFHLTNYGIGGYDYLNTNQADTGESDIRNDHICVTMFLSKVRVGGEVVFPWLQLSVKPEERAALVVYIVGTGSDITLDGVCPVVRGNKWTATTQVILKSN